ncbi:HAD-IC family P-type ATPase [Pelagicoccus sp. SDUM812003]|uniref:heavy metal translocating P-type ATPase n=1 Tax=Pelagicoccus sp. SDUM812003 TaxID=3041267 RepID=UPI00280FA400|nr:HAD-IC family P-type ATPase [Pelagicoccus sp. SDUM812003]MDQ8203053.1 HAD-IC family P-type ATPase [Pelagicoccus sp. SDUM812003]
MNSSPPSQLYQVTGLWCTSCAHALQRAVSRLPGISDCSVDFATHTLKATGRDSRCFDKLQSLTRGLGYELAPYRDVRETVERSATQLNAEFQRACVLTFFATWTMGLALVDYTEAAGPLGFQEFRWLALASAFFSVSGIVFGAKKVYTIGLIGLVRGKPSIDSLLLITSLGCLSLSFLNLLHDRRELYFDSAIMVLTVVAWIRFASSRLTHRQLNVIFESLHTPDELLRLLDENGVYENKPISSARVGSKIRVEAGETVPIDGYVEAGKGRLQIALFTGESDPLPISAGNNVVAGETLVSGSIDIVATKPYGMRYIDQLSRETIESFHDQKSESRLEKTLGYSAPVLLVSAALFLPFSLGLTGSLEVSLVSTFSLLVVACPCALFFAANIPLIRSQEWARESGIIVYKPRSLRKLDEIDTVGLDKTGTLSHRAPCLSLAKNDTDIPEHRLWAVLGAAERNCHHPIANAVAQRCAEVDGPPEKVERVKLEARAIRFEWSGQPWRFGESNQPDRRDQLQLVSLQDPSLTAFFTIEEESPKTVHDLIAAFRQRGELHLLSGDSASRVDAFAKRHCIGSARSRLSPEDKANHLSSLHRRGRSILYFGDGYNDIPALKASQFGLVPPHAAPAVRLAADAQLLRNDAEALKRLFAIGRTLTIRVRQNVVLAAGYNLIAIPAAISGQLTPGLAAAAMASAIGAVALNSMRA